MKYAQILNEKVHWVGNYDKKPNFHPKAGKFIDITDLETQPKEGWEYENKSFIQPIIAAVEVKEVVKIKVDTLTDKEFKKLVLEKIGIECE